MKKIIIFALAILMMTQTGCEWIHTEDYNGNNIYNIRASGRILELEDHTIYFTIAEGRDTYLYHIDNDLNTLSKQEIDVQGLEYDYGPIEFYYLNIIGNSLYCYDYTSENVVKIRLDETKEVLKPKIVLSTKGNYDNPYPFGAGVTSILISNRRIYINYKFMNQEVYGLNSYNLNGKNEKEHDSSFYPLGPFVSNGDIYYYDLEKMYKNKDLLYECIYKNYLTGLYFVIYDNYVYANVGRDGEPINLVRFRLDKEKDNIIHEEDYEFIYKTDAFPTNFYDDKMIIRENKKMYIANLDGSDKKKIWDKVNWETMMTKDYIFMATQTGLEVFDYNGDHIKVFKSS